MISKVKDKEPTIPVSAFVAENATVIGDVTIGESSSVWFGAVIRGDQNTIKIGSRTNIQDLCVLHVDDDNAINLGDDVTVGHKAILHGCEIENNVLVGMGAVIMNGVKIGRDSIIGAGALVTERVMIPPRSLVVGFPAKVRRELTDEEVEFIKWSSAEYVKNAKLYMGE